MRLGTQRVDRTTQAKMSASGHFSALSGAIPTLRRHRRMTESFAGLSCCDAKRGFFPDGVVGCDLAEGSTHEAPRVHHAARRRGGCGMAARGARAAAGAVAQDYVGLVPSALKSPKPATWKSS